MCLIKKLKVLFIFFSLTLSFQNLNALENDCIIVDNTVKQVSFGLWEQGWQGFYTTTGKLNETVAYAKSKTTFYLGAEFG